MSRTTIATNHDDPAAPRPDPYDGLHEGVRRWIDDRGWHSWTTIQRLALPAIAAGHDALLVAPTASGKTEAALLPLISRLLETAARPIALLYIAPLRALINDQTQRAHKLIEDNGLRAAWWHGDLPAAKRKAILRRPPHVLFTTPESLDVMLSSATYGYGSLLGEVRAVLIDEIHAFVENDRGAQLLAAITRLESGRSVPLQRVALSATIGNPAAVAAWMQGHRPARGAEVIVDTSTRGRRLAVGVIPQTLTPGMSRAERDARDLERLAATIARHVTGKRAIVFTSARAGAEALTLALADLGIETHIHHGSIDRDGRRATEAAFKTDGPRTIVATSTLELGIDIGDLEIIVQVGPTSTASSLLQRIGRSGRRDDAASVGIVYATSRDELPEALAAADLALSGTVEACRPSDAAIQVLFQQIIQLVRERDGISRNGARDVLCDAGCFAGITEVEYTDLVDEMISGNFLDADPTGRMRVGYATERFLGYANYRDFYTLFETEDGWTVRSGGATIGTLDRSYPIAANREVIFILAGRRWRVVHADQDRHILEVEPASTGAIPAWHADGPGSSFELMRRTIALLDRSLKTPLEKPALAPMLEEIRAEVAATGVSSTSFGLRLGKAGTDIWTFAGTDLNAYLATLMMASVPGSAAVTFSSRHLTVPCALDAATETLVRILTDEGYRGTLQAEAIDLITSAPQGKYWAHFGPKTKRHIQARSLAARARLLLLLPAMRIDSEV